MGNNLYIVTLDFEQSCSEIAEELRTLAQLFEEAGDVKAREAVAQSVLGVKLFRLQFLAEMAEQMRGKGRLH